VDFPWLAAAMLIALGLVAWELAVRLKPARTAVPVAA
jgi:hypothetical protein